MSLLTSFFLALIPSAASITFNYSNITPSNSHEIILSGAAYTSTEDGIHVPYKSDNGSWEGIAGRATYIRSLHLWDQKSTKLSSFSTSFTFKIKANVTAVYGHGLTFFLAQNNSVINAGGSIGLPFNIQKNTSLYPFVAVEFDTFGSQEWDPKDLDGKFLGDHVGININSVTSVQSRRWISDTNTGRECSAFIEYNSDSNILGVSFTSFEDNTAKWIRGLDYTVDLREVLPEWVIFGFSASTGDRYEKNVLKSWMFDSTDLKDDESSGKNNSFPKTGSITAGTVFLVIVLGIIAYLIWRRKNKKDDNTEVLESSLEMNNEIGIGATIPRRFSYLELAASTADFAKAEKLGEGGFGGVYKGFLKDLNMYVAVKRVSNTSNQGIKEYVSEVRIISQLRHRNLVQLIGWCHEKRELLLVYEFLENGSLDLHLFKGKSLLTWSTRYKIVNGLASALLYLHEEWEQCVLHRDIKSSNVMLDSNFNAKLGDFGLAKLVSHENGAETTMVAGTIGYMAPEYIETGKASKESDVFSFGVVALEIACGRKPNDSQAEEKKKKLIEWVWDLYGAGNILEASDPCLGSNYAEEEMVCLMVVGLWCAHPDSKLRPSMKQAIQVLHAEASLPILQAKMPHVNYSALPNFSDYANTLSSGATLSSGSN